MSLRDCRLITLPHVADGRGGLMFAEGAKDIPFEIRRIYALYDVPDGAMRGAHGHRELEQVFVAMSGSFEVTISDGVASQTWRLERPDMALYVGKMLWREVTNFTPGAVCLVLASRPYEEADYFREWDGYLRARGLAA